MMRLTAWLIGALTFFSLACISKPKVTQGPTCEGADWYELGRRDGSQGAPTNRLSQRERDCARSLNPDWETIYLNGRNAGLVEYCEPKNAYELGRMGLSYYFVCPTTAELEFLAQYRKGQQARELELLNQKLDEKIDEVSLMLVKTDSTSEQETLNSQLTELKQMRARNEQELSKITAQ